MEVFLCPKALLRKESRFRPASLAGRSAGVSFSAMRKKRKNRQRGPPLWIPREEVTITGCGSPVGLGCGGVTWMVRKSCGCCLLLCSIGTSTARASLWRRSSLVPAGWQAGYTWELDGQSLRLVGADCVSLASPLRGGASLAHAVAPPLPTKSACAGLWRGPNVAPCHLPLHKGGFWPGAFFNMVL